MTGATALRVLMVTTEWPRVPWGTAQFVARQAAFLRAAGVDVEVFQFRGARRPWRYGAAWWQVRRRLARQHFDLVHAQFGQSALLALPKRVPLVITFRGDDLQGVLDNRAGRLTTAGRLLRRFSRWVAHRADAVIVVAAHMRRYLDNGTGTPVHVVPSGIDLELFRPIPQAKARARLGLPAGEHLVLFVGSPRVARKRFALAEQAVAILNRTMPARLVVGWGVAHEEMPYYMGACDALVFTSVQEGSPNAVKEALACNLPVVSVPVADVPERLDGVAGCEVCADERPETIAAALARVLRRRVRSAGREAVRQLDERLVTEQVVAIYRSALNGRGHR
jgi:glycosyltransferase involved in cell wall biosynthesis